MALSYIHLGQRLELDIARGVMGGSSTTFTSLLDPNSVVNAPHSSIHTLFVYAIS